MRRRDCHLLNEKPRRTHRRAVLILIAIAVWCANAIAQENPPSTQLTFLAFGDVNFGRFVGRKLLRGNPDYPFANVKDTLTTADFVFANLECAFSEKVRKPADIKLNGLNLCGPVAAAKSLQRANIKVVSTANNHAYDCGLAGIAETIQSLRREGVLFAGVSEDSVATFAPAIMTCKGLRVGFMAYTQFVNSETDSWRGRIALFDEERARAEIDSLKQQADFVVASYHGGIEFAERPSRAALQQMRALIDAGADLVLGHHPHVPQGIERYHGKLIFYSLGNFVFCQPQEYWAHRSFGAAVTLQKDDSAVKLTAVRLLPIRACKQPGLLTSAEEKSEVIKRIQSLSAPGLVNDQGEVIIHAPALARRK
jgi:poly-gamma-glutamate synthesis protein (capsule biosynthesis protein)